jgi:hypothetical protein
MAHCCKDSAAMKVIAMDGEPYEGMLVSCRWCSDGYARYTKGRWTYSTETADRIKQMASPENRAGHNAWLADIRGRQCAKALKEEK